MPALKLHEDMPVPHPHLAPAQFFHKAFTPSSLATIRALLNPATASSPATGLDSSKPDGLQGRTGDASVLIPLMNLSSKVDVKGKGKAIDESFTLPGILLEVRNGGMRLHGGEISFPGGKYETSPPDESLFHTATRETFEELGILPSQVEYLGRLRLRGRKDEQSKEGWVDDGPVRSLSGLKVWAYVAFIHPLSSSSGSSSLTPSTTPFPSFPLEALTPSPSEVLQILPLPLFHLVNSSTSNQPNIIRRRLRKSLTKDRVPSASSDNSKQDQDSDLDEDREHYIAIRNLSSFLIPPSPPSISASSAKQAINTDANLLTPEKPTVEEELQVWGLTAWIMNIFFRRVGVWKAVVDAVDGNGTGFEVEGRVERPREEFDDNVLGGKGVENLSGTGGGGKAKL